MNVNRIKRNQMLGEKVVKALESRNIEAFYVESKEAALEKALELIPEGSKVAWGGSMSIEEIGLKKAICDGNYNEINRDLAKNLEEKRALEIATYDADFFLTSANAISEDGVIVNIDGNSNRVSAIAYGPKHVIMIIGMNKVVKDAENALSRARNEAAPINAQRFNIDTPCKKTGACFDCLSPTSICCQFLVTRRSMHAGRMKVILVNEDLGF